MANQILLCLLIISLLSIGQLTFASERKSSNERLEKKDNFVPQWEERQHHLPEFMRVSGVASGYLPSEQVIIEFDIETLGDSAGTSLLQNNKSISKAINEMKKAGVEESELTTQDMRIFPSYREEYDGKIKSYQSTIEGYKVENKLKFISKKLFLAGKVIDIAVSNGINKISSVQFVPTQTKIKELKDSLISQAVEDAVKRANLALQSLNYEIKSVKKIDIENDSHGKNQIYKSKASFLESYSPGSELSEETKLFDNLKKFTVSVNVSFIIGRKESS
ncbi:outer membrane protein (macronuclear) [Tetrahymena thermophila SB210]|uniref:Outer membrane protein n=1 Tax=Tetrahymena thermophila (strain SB210) TaxID=312017 RepID=Q23VE1_TETTS|nr:outer membrane protein [Tetrahymena thermophila SB210]EAS00495.1 outer membrane protein [Tetrahymena thermophila SB210]|eukprot:XP_001020740.1 outer membrane protein [Tetrahymena thermophila SB210]